jgi:nucleotide-binding universal stress UspA family protein
MEYAERLQPNLIILGAKGLRGTLGILLGGVASQVVEYACCPVLIVRAPYHGLNRILLALDASPYSQKALHYLINLRLPSEIDLRILHVLPPLPIKPPPDFLTHTWPVGPEVLPPPIQEPTQEELTLQKKEEEEGQILLQRAISTLNATGLQPRGVLLRGDAATEILEYARYHEADLIICGSRGLSPVKGWLLGSVSRKLVHYAGCSVMIVKEAGI